MYSRSEIREKEEKKARVAKALKMAKASADARMERAKKSGSVSVEDNNIMPPQNVPATPAVPPTVMFTTGHTMEGIMNMANKNKMAVYKDPVDGSSSKKRKANGHADAPPPKKANTNTFVPRVPGERYQGTAARPPPDSRTILKSKPVTQNKVRNNAMDVDAQSPLQKRKTVQQQKPKVLKAMELDISSSLGRKRDAEDDLDKGTLKKQRLDTLPPSNLIGQTSSSLGKKRDAEDDLDESAAKKQRLNTIPSSNLMLPQNSQAGKAAPKAGIAVKPAPKTNFFKSLYPKDSKLKASAGRAVVTTEIIRTAVPPTKKLPTPTATSRGAKSPEEKAPSGQGISRKGKQTPADKETASPKQTSSHQSPTVSTEEIENSLERKNGRASGENSQNKKQKRGDGSVAHNEKYASGDASASVKGTTKPASPSEGEVRKSEARKSQIHACKAENSVDDPMIEIEHQHKGKELSPASALDHTPSTNRHPISSTVGNNLPLEEDNTRVAQLGARGAKPRGLRNAANACYINSVLQAIANIPRMADHYRGLANRVIPEIAEYVALNAKNLEGGDTVTNYKYKPISEARERLKALLEKNKSKICLGAHLGVLLNAMLDADPSPDAPSSYVFGQVCGVLLKNDKGDGYNGEEQRECMEFFEKLLDHLDVEEVSEQTEHFDKPSLVRELFGLEAVTKIKCQSCGHARDSCVEKKFAFTTDMPRRQNSKRSSSGVSITECLDTYSHPDHVEVHCDSCGKTSEASKWMQLKNLSPYVLVNLNRVMFSGGANQRQPDFTKNPDHISLPPSEVVTMKDEAQDVRYKVIGDMKHKGTDFTRGHWVSSMKIDDQWWHFDDHSANKTALKGAVTTNVLLKRLQ